MTVGTNESNDGAARDVRPKAVHRDELAYLIVVAGLAAYAKTNDIRTLLVCVLMYAIGNFSMRGIAQVLEGRKNG